LETARKLKAKGLEIEMIAEVTGLDAETLKENFLKKSDF
jgi:predicted transposase YdaD